MDGGVLPGISDCGHDVRGGRQSSRRAEPRLQMEQRHVCVNIMARLTDTDNDGVLTESQLYLLSSPVYPVHQLVSALALLFQVQLQLCDPVLYKPRGACSVIQSRLLAAPLSYCHVMSYLHQFDLASSVFFGVGLCLGLALQILELFLQRLLPERGLVALPPTPLQLLLLLRQLQHNTATLSRMRNQDGGSSPAPGCFLNSDPIGAIWGNLAIN